MKRPISCCWFFVFICFLLTLRLSFLHFLKVYNNALYCLVEKTFEVYVLNTHSRRWLQYWKSVLFNTNIFRNPDNFRNSGCVIFFYVHKWHHVMPQNKGVSFYPKIYYVGWEKTLAQKRGCFSVFCHFILHRRTQLRRTQLHTMEILFHKNENCFTNSWEEWWSWKRIVCIFMMWRWGDFHQRAFAST